MGPVELHHLRRPVVLAAFSGWNDAGDAATGVLDHLTDTCDTEFVFALDPDDYYDFTENRPVLVRQDNGERSIQWATTEVLVARLPDQDHVLVNGPDEVWIDRGGGLERAAVSFPDDAAVRRLAQRLAASAGRRPYKRLTAMPTRNRARSRTVGTNWPNRSGSRSDASCPPKACANSTPSAGKSKGSSQALA